MFPKFVVVMFLLLAVLVGLSVFFFPRSSVSLQEQGAFSDNFPVAATIIMDGKKFIPEKVTIKKWEKVKWVNQGKEAHWPASNLHPTHEIYPEFDPLEGVQPGKSWTFVFTQGGTWKYHDHLYPLTRGVIEVKE